MTYIDVPTPEEAAGDAAELYARETERVGYLPNYARVFALRPEAYVAWRQLVQAIMGVADPRRYELATFAAAKRVRSTYCSVAHASVLAQKWYSADEVRALPGGLDETDAALVAFADEIAADASSATQADVDRLRALGLSDAEITDVVLAVAARKFFSTVLEALGAEPDAAYEALDPELRKSVTFR